MAFILPAHCDTIQNSYIQPKYIISLCWLNTWFPLRTSNISRNIMQTRKNIEYVISIHPPCLFMGASKEESTSLNIDLSHRKKTKHIGLNDTVKEDGDNFNVVFLLFGFVWCWVVEEQEPSQENPQRTIFIWNISCTESGGGWPVLFFLFFPGPGLPKRDLDCKQSAKLPPVMSLSG